MTGSTERSATHHARFHVPHASTSSFHSHAYASNVPCTARGRSFPRVRRANRLFLRSHQQASFLPRIHLTRVPHAFPSIRCFSYVHRICCTSLFADVRFAPVTFARILVPPCRTREPWTSARRVVLRLEWKDSHWESRFHPVHSL